eukprot:48797-Eustigmatos_ZCMA.PRE.1
MLMAGGPPGLALKPYAWQFITWFADAMERLAGVTFRSVLVIVTMICTSTWYCSHRYKEMLHNLSSSRYDARRDLLAIY